LAFFLAVNGINSYGLNAKTQLRSPDKHLGFGFVFVGNQIQTLQELPADKPEPALAIGYPLFRYQRYQPGHKFIG